jgi:hypothetical protein
MAEQQGPQVELKLSCRGCEHMQSTCEVDEQGDHDWTHSCGHPDMPTDRAYLGYTPRTPVFCPLRAAAIAATVKQLGFVSVAEVKSRLPTKAAMYEIEAREQAATRGPWASDYQPTGPCGAKCYRDQIIAYTPTQNGRQDRTTIAVRPNAAFNGPGKETREQEIADGQFISHARSDIPRLIANIGSVRQLIGDDD